MLTGLFTVKRAVRALRLRYQVVRRLILSKKMRTRRDDGRAFGCAASKSALAG